MQIGIDQWRAFRNSYLGKLRNDIDFIAAMPEPVFGELVIDCSLLEDETNTERMIAELNSLGVDNFTPVLYFFTFNNCPADELLSRAEEQKNIKRNSSTKTYRAMPKINRTNKDVCNGVLYVGKTNKNFISRFRQHLGLVPSDTYALQLKFWATGFTVSLFVSPMKLSSDQVQYLESIETVLHYNLKPLLGRSGH